tara:strand:+ start:176 stop:550 length:375 start_codon:yes stop_codon:yes gene_type:complete
MGWNDNVNVEVLIGKTITHINEESYELIFTCSDDTQYRMFHEQDCCENVELEDICGDLSDLINSEIIMAEESESEDYDGKERDYTPDSCTWTFYKFGTMKGYVTLRWFGESNGYYSESVSFQKI